MVKKCKPYLVARSGAKVAGVLAWTLETGDGNEKARCIMCSLFLYIVNIQNVVFCEESLEKNHASYVHLTYKKMPIIFGINGLVRETYCLKAHGI